METSWLKYIAESKDVALLISLTFNALAAAALALMWRRYVALEQRATSLLGQTVEELCRFLDREK